MIWMISVAALLGIPSTPETPQADFVLVGKVFTARRDHSRAEALAIQGNTILAVGTREEMEQHISESTRIIDTKGQSIVPGFNDAHCHFSVGAMVNYEVDLGGAKSLEEMLQRIKKFAEAHPDIEAIQGGNWQLASLPGQKYPTAKMLDAIVPDKPVLLWSEGPHGIWVNSVALKEAELDPEKEFPGIRMLKDPETGELTGTFVGRGLLFLFGDYFEFPEFTTIQKRLQEELEKASRLGVTSVQEPNANNFTIAIYAQMQREGKLPLRYHTWVMQGTERSLDPEEMRTMDQVAGIEHWVEIDTYKNGLDGMPQLRTAALLEPYTDDTKNRGDLWDGGEEIKEAVLEASEGGVPVAIHATGDRAVRLALDAFEASRKKYKVRHRVEHAFLIHPEDYPRFAQNDVVVSLQPSFLSRDLDHGIWYEQRFGKKRSPHVMPMKSLLEKEAILAFGTDFNLTPLNPMIGLHAAVTRQSPAGSPAGGWIPAERISLEEAVRAYTWGSAYAQGKETVKGTLAPGMLADLVILSEDIFAIPPAKLLEVTVDLTMVDGKIVYQSKP